MFKLLVLSTSVQAANLFGVRERTIRVNLPLEYNYNPKKPIQLPEIQGKEAINVMIYASSELSSYKFIKQIPENCADALYHYQSLGHEASFVVAPPNVEHVSRLGTAASCMIKVEPCILHHSSKHCEELVSRAILVASPR
jgi:hypothetical protein